MQEAGRSRLGAILLAALMAGALVPGIAQAQGVAPGTPIERRAAYDAAFRTMEADPANLDKAFAFATVATEVGDYEGAVAALERMLLINGDLPRVRLELGVLYYRLGSYEMARTYVQSVLASPDLPPPVRTRAEEFNAQIEKRASPTQLTGSLSMGLRYQSNANAAPGGSGVLVGGIPFQLDDNSTSKDDGNVFAIGTLRHTIDLGTQSGDFWESTGSLYIARQFSQQQVNLTYITTTSGPQLRILGDWLDDLWVRPYAIFDFAALRDRTEFAAPGGGVALERRRADGLLTYGAAFEARYQDYYRQPEKPLNEERTGGNYALRLYGQYAATDTLLVFGTLLGERMDAKANSESYVQAGISGGVAVNYDGLFGDPAQRWITAVSATVLGSWYDGTDPASGPANGFKAREEQELRLSVTTTVPVAENWYVNGTLGRNQRFSNIPNYDYTNYLMSLDATWRF